jgi:hypothetical protein
MLSGCRTCASANQRNGTMSPRHTDDIARHQPPPSAGDVRQCARRFGTRNHAVVTQACVKSSASSFEPGGCPVLWWNPEMLIVVVCSGQLFVIRKGYDNASKRVCVPAVEPDETRRVYYAVLLT